jgi:hypothetical protein
MQYRYNLAKLQRLIFKHRRPGKIVLSARSRWLTTGIERVFCFIGKVHFFNAAEGYEPTEH